MNKEQFFALLDEQMTLKHQVSKLTHTIDTLEYQREVFADLLAEKHTAEMLRANRAVIEAKEKLSFLRLAHKTRLSEIEDQFEQYRKDKE